MTRRLRPDSRSGGRTVLRSALTTEARWRYSPKRTTVSQAKYIGLKEAMREGPPMVRNIALARRILIPHSGHRQIAAMQSAQSAAMVTRVETMPFQYADQNARSSSAPLAITKRNQSPSIVIPKCVRANQSAPSTSRQYPTTAAITPRVRQE